MDNWFGDKTRQVEPPHLTAFGIELCSTQGRYGEVRALLDFAHMVARAGHAAAVVSVECDSKIGQYDIALRPGIAADSVSAQAVLAIATGCFTSLRWFGEDIYP